MPNSLISKRRKKTKKFKCEYDIQDQPLLVSAEEHLAVQRETKARTTLLTALPDDHMGDFYIWMIPREYGNAIKAEFVERRIERKVRKSFETREFKEFKITEAEISLIIKNKRGLESISLLMTCTSNSNPEFDVKGYAPKPSSLANPTFVSTASNNNNNDTSSNHSPSYSTSTSYSGNREAYSSHGSVVDDVIHSFLLEKRTKTTIGHRKILKIEKTDLEE
ncbi:hypothetical protein Tco_0408382 [Tanacetum coccineum]